MSTLTRSPLRTSRKIRSLWSVSPSRWRVRFRVPHGDSAADRCPLPVQAPAGDRVHPAEPRPDLRLAELATVVYMSPYHFARLFKGSTGVPPHRFVVRQRIARARAFLAAQELSIAQIARRVGFRTRVTSPRCSAASRASRREDTERGICRNRPGREGG